MSKVLTIQNNRIHGFPEAMIETPFGKLRLVVNNATHVQVFAGNDLNAPDSPNYVQCMIVNGVGYHGRLAFEKRPGEAWDFVRKDNGHTSYNDGISMRRSDKWSEHLSPAARKKVEKEFPKLIEEIMTTGTMIEATHSADENELARKVQRARAKVAELQGQLAEASQELAALESQCS